VLSAEEARLTALEAQARAAGAGYEVLTWWDRVPEALVEDRALLGRRMSTDAPSGNVPVEEEHEDAARRNSTYDAEPNRPMVAVNEALGFRRAGGLSAWTRRLGPSPGRTRPRGTR
jgi:hypothetical protein